MHNSTRSALTLGCSLLFAACGAIGRFTLQMVETRYQILTFCLLAALLELSVSSRDPAPAVWRIMVNSTAAAVAIIAVKWHLEGISPLLLQVLS